MSGDERHDGHRGAGALRVRRQLAALPVGARRRPHRRGGALAAGDARGRRPARARFLDVGSGSGLFSLAAARLGAAPIHSFDFDPASVACTTELKRRFIPSTRRGPWSARACSTRVHRASLGTWDVVYSWGVLHHTGAMWEAFDRRPRRGAGRTALRRDLQRSGGSQPRVARRQAPVQQPAGAVARALRRCGHGAARAARPRVRDGAARSRPLRPPWTRYRSSRGMSRGTTSSTGSAATRSRSRGPRRSSRSSASAGFELERMRTVGGRLGCNEFVLRRRDEGSRAGST